MFRCKYLKQIARNQEGDHEKCKRLMCRRACSGTERTNAGPPALNTSGVLRQICSKLMSYCIIAL